MTIQRFPRALAMALVLVLCGTCTVANSEAAAEGPATRELKKLVAADPVFKRLLVSSIERARQANPDPVTNPAQSLEQYVEFVAWAERALPGDVLKQKPDATLYQRLDQSLGYLYFVCDQPLEEIKGRGVLQQLTAVCRTLCFVEPGLCPVLGRISGHAAVLERRSPAPGPG